MPDPVLEQEIPETTSVLSETGIDSPAEIIIPQVQRYDMAAKDWTDAFADVRANTKSYLPWINMLDLVDSARMYRASTKVRDGTATPEEKQFLERSLADMQRSSTFGYKVWNTLFNLPKWGIEFLGVGSIVKGVAKEAIRAGLKKAAGEALEKAAPFSNNK